MADALQRAERLDRLEQAVTQYCDKEDARVEQELAFLKRVLKGRTGAERLNNETVVSATGLVVDEIASFLAE